MKKILLLFILSLFPILAFSQTEIMYDYDYAGNRIKREIMMIVQKSQTKKQALNQLEFYTDKVNSHLIKIYPNPTRGELRVCIVTLSLLINVGWNYIRSKVINL